MIPTEELTKIKDRLLAAKNKLESTIRGLRRTENFGSDVDDGGEESAETEELIINDGVRRTLKERLGNIVRAITKINEHQYGVCERCGKEISLDLLNVDPESTLCKDCKAKLR